MQEAIDDLLDAIRRMAENYQIGEGDIVVESEDFYEIVKRYDKVRFLRDREIAGDIVVESEDFYEVVKRYDKVRFLRYREIAAAAKAVKA